jgi:hypothetical protein
MTINIGDLAEYQTDEGRLYSGIVEGFIQHNNELFWFGTDPSCKMSVGFYVSRSTVRPVKVQKVSPQKSKPSR